MCQLVYDDGSTVEGGNEMLIQNTQKEPTVSFPTTAGRYYSLLMVDPDNFSREKPSFRQFIHWFVVNIPGVAGGQGVNVDAGFVVSPYMVRLTTTGQQCTTTLRPAFVDWLLCCCVCCRVRLSTIQGCAPDAGSGRHRYVFLLYEQQAAIATENVKVLGQPKLLGLVANLDERKSHDIAKWFNENAAGQQPTVQAGNFFFAQKV